MPNTGVMTSKMDGLWCKPQFWELLNTDRSDVMKQFSENDFAKVLVPNSHFLKTMRKYVPEYRLREIFNADYLAGVHPDICIFCVLHENEPDSVSTYMDYTTDERIATGISEFFPDEKVSCSWFVDGIGDYGDCVFYRGEVLDRHIGNMQDDLEEAMLEKDPSLWETMQVSETEPVGSIYFEPLSEEDEAELPF